MCTITTTYWECGHVKGEPATNPCDDPENCVKNYVDSPTPAHGNCGDSKYTSILWLGDVDGRVIPATLRTVDLGMVNLR